MLSTVALTTLLTLFAIDSQDLCADVYLDLTGAPLVDAGGQSVSRYCEWTGPNPPVWDADVCCTIDDDSAACTTVNVDGRCDTGERMYCEYGEEIAGGVVCYQPFDSACDHGLCVQAPEEPPPVVAELMCCNGGGCVPIVPTQIEDCWDSESIILWCNHGETSADGSITCYD